MTACVVASNSSQKTSYFADRYCEKLGLCRIHDRPNPFQPVSVPSLVFCSASFPLSSCFGLDGIHFELGKIAAFEVIQPHLDLLAKLF